MSFLNVNNHLKYFSFIKNIDIENITPIQVLLKLKELKEKIENCGFLTTGWSEDEVAIHGYPAFLKNPEFSFRSIFTEIDYSKMIDEERIARSACRSSIMAGDSVSEEECLLIKQLLKCENPFLR